MPYNNTFHNAVSFELNPNRVVYYRRVFSLLNWLAEIGGLIGVSKSVCLFIVATLHYRGVYQFLMADLFVKSSSSKESLAAGNMSQRTRLNYRNNVQWRTCKVLCFNIKFYKQILSCLRSKPRIKTHTTYNQLLREISITHLLRELRILKLFAKKRTTLKQWR